MKNDFIRYKKSERLNVDDLYKSESGHERFGHTGEY